MAICFPQATGVPFAGGPPVWWNDVDGSLAAINRRLDDPRWRGATRVGLGAAGVSENASFRGLHAVDAAGKTWLYLSWTVKAANAAQPTLNYVDVGFETQSGDAYVFHVEPFPLQPEVPSRHPVHRLAGTNVLKLGGPNPPASIAPWLQADGRVFVADAGLWAISLRVPIKTAAEGAADVDAAGLRLAASFKFGFQVKVVLATGGPTTYTYPRSGAFAILNKGTWDTASAGGAGCGEVVSISPGQIRCSPAPEHQIRFSRSGLPAPENHLIASPLNSTLQQVPGGAIQARFFIANWGSQPDPNDVPSGIWKEIAVPGQTATNANPINPGVTGDIQLNWTVNNDHAPLLSEFRTPPAIPGNPPPRPLRRSHQCMLVELSGGGLNFSPSSATRNMDFVAASTFTREAEISVRGLPDPGTPERDVYLLVRARNMPERVQAPRPDPGPTKEGRGRGLVAAVKAAATRRGGGESANGDGHGIDEGYEEHEEYDPSATDLSGFDLLARDLPTYTVYAFHDTGEVDAESGLPVLAPQVPFGYVVDHDGPLHGWTHELRGDLTLVGPDLYRLRVPTGGTAVVTTRIEALERPLTWWRRVLRWLLAHLHRLCPPLWRAIRRLLRH